MDFADETTRQVIGVSDVLGSASPASVYGRELARTPVAYRARDQALWETQQRQLGEVEIWWDGDVVAAAAEAFTQWPTLERPLLVLAAGGVLDEVALFELKRFLYWGAQLVRLAAPAVTSVSDEWADAFDDMMAFIHPEEQPSPRFVLAPALDVRLEAARQEVRRARHSSRAERQALEGAVVAQLGGSFGINGSFVPPEDAQPIVDPRLRPSGGDRYELCDPHITELEDDVRTAQERCREVEIEVRTRLSDRLRTSVEWLTTVREALGLLDGLCARVELRRSWDGCWPEWGQATQIHHGGHPKLLAAVGSDGLQPVTIEVDSRPVIVTGPNMGGKSLLLELVGLCQWCAQHAYPVPAARYVFAPVESMVYVGSEESGGPRTGLSSFGREVRRVVDASASASPILWLLDEFARGTHPDEGAEIAADFIESRHAKTDRVVAVTHFPALARLSTAAHFQIAGISHPEALAELGPSPSVEDMEAALRAAMDYRPVRCTSDTQDVPRDARLVARALGLDLDQ